MQTSKLSTSKKMLALTAGLFTVAAIGFSGSAQACHGKYKHYYRGYTKPCHSCSYKKYYRSYTRVYSPCSTCRTTYRCDTCNYVRSYDYGTTCNTCSYGYGGFFGGYYY